MLRIFLTSILLGASVALSVLGYTSSKWETNDKRFVLPIIKIEGKTEYYKYQLVRLRVDIPKDMGECSILWRVKPRITEIASTDSSILEFVAPPGDYVVECLIVAVKEGKPYLSVDEVIVKILDKDGPDVLPPPKPDDKKDGKPKPDDKKDEKPKPDDKKIEKVDAWNAISKLYFQGAFCSGTVISYKNNYLIVTAAHCLTSRTGKGETRNGIKFDFSIIYSNKKADVAIALVVAKQDLPVARISQVEPKPNEPVWHGGYGFDIPGNKEVGNFVDGPDSNNQYRFVLNVSSGDSGGGIFNQRDELISCVCCTLGIAKKTYMWGCSLQAINEGLKTVDDILKSNAIDNSKTNIKVSNTNDSNNYEHVISKIQEFIRIEVKEMLRQRYRKIVNGQFLALEEDEINLMVSKVSDNYIKELAKLFISHDKCCGASEEPFIVIVKHYDVISFLTELVFLKVVIPD